MVKKKLLLSKLVLRGDTWRDLAKKLDVYGPTLHAKLRGDSEFKASEIKKIMEIYSLTPDEVVDIFLSDGAED